MALGSVRTPQTDGNTTRLRRAPGPTCPTRNKPQKKSTAKDTTFRRLSRPTIGDLTGAFRWRFGPRPKAPSTPSAQPRYSQLHVEAPPNLQTTKPSQAKPNHTACLQVCGDRCTSILLGVCPARPDLSSGPPPACTPSGTRVSAFCLGKGFPLKQVTPVALDLFFW